MSQSLLAVSVVGVALSSETLNPNPKLGSQGLKILQAQGIKGFGNLSRPWKASKRFGRPQNAV